MSEEILFEKRGQIGLITLNRPEALNALNTRMCIDLHAKLDEWAADDKVLAVIIIGAGERAFCAGGDVISLYRSGQVFRDGDETSTEWRRFFREEYRLNVAIKEFPKPYIAIMDGITMGGGVGVSVHGQYRVATENTLFAMPETSLGLIPDVGGGWFLPRLGRGMGLFLSLTGVRLKAGETCGLGITQNYMESKQIPMLISDLAASADDIGGTIARYSTEPKGNIIAPHYAAITAFFSQNSVEEIIETLKSNQSEWAQGWYKKLLEKSPISLKLTFLQMLKGENMETFRENMKMEFRIVNHIIMGNDFYEGVRAILIDKDGNPQWSPAALEDITGDVVEGHFDSLGKNELTFD